MKAFVHETAVVDEGAYLGDDTKVWHYSHISTGATVGRECNIGQNVYIAKNVVVGDHVKIQNNVSVYEGVILEDYVFCGPSAVFTNVRTPRCQYPRNTSADYLKTIIRYGASIGANATIVCGVTVGRHAFIGAGAVVTHDVPDYAMVYGNPAKIRGYMCACGEVQSDINVDRLTCQRCSTDYCPGT